MVFKETPSLRSQQTIVSLLSSCKYYFVPISEYDTQNFYLVMDVQSEMKKNHFTSWLDRVMKKIDKSSPAKTEHVLMISYLSAEGYIKDTPLVLTRTDVENIIEDLPENYIGEKIIGDPSGK